MEDLFIDVLNDRKFPFVNNIMTTETTVGFNLKNRDELLYQDTENFYQVWRQNRLKQEEFGELEGILLILRN